MCTWETAGGAGEWGRNENAGGIGPPFVEGMDSRYAVRILARAALSLSARRSSSLSPPQTP